MCQAVGRCFDGCRPDSVAYAVRSGTWCTDNESAVAIYNHNHITRSFAYQATCPASLRTPFCTVKSPNCYEWLIITTQSTKSALWVTLYHVARDSEPTTPWNHLPRLQAPTVYHNLWRLHIDLLADWSMDTNANKCLPPSLWPS